MNLLEKRRIYKGLKMVAKRKGVPLKIVIMELELAIEREIFEAEISGESKRVRQWKEIPCKGEYPDAYEFLSYVSRQLREEECGLGMFLCT